MQALNQHTLFRIAAQYFTARAMKKLAAQKNNHQYYFYPINHMCS